MNAIEEAQCRVARAQEERDKLHEEIMQKHGALRDLDTACKAEKAKDSCAMYNGKAHRLRQNYQKSVAELRLAKSALERERNEAKQAEGRPSPVMDERTPMQRAVAMAEPIVLDDARVEDGALVATAPPELQDLKGGTGTVVGVLPNGDAVVELELGPEGPAEDAEGATAYDGLLQRYKAVCDRIEAFPPTYGNPTKEEKILKKERLQLRKDLKAMAPLKTCWFCCSFSINNYDNPCRSGKLDASAARRQVQLDLELQPVKLPEGVVEDIKVSRKRVYREDFYTLSISEGDLANFSGLSFDAKRQTVATKLRIKPDEDDDFDPDDVPDQIRHFVRILDLAALRLKGERAAMEAKEALQALRGEA